jgi:hypothetical protein
VSEIKSPLFTRDDVEHTRLVAGQCESLRLGLNHAYVLRDLSERIEAMLSWFTREDVETLRETAHQMAREGQTLGPGSLPDWLNDLADRIEALLPPES